MLQACKAFWVYVILHKWNPVEQKHIDLITQHRTKDWNWYEQIIYNEIKQINNLV